MFRRKWSDLTPAGFYDGLETAQPGQVPMVQDDGSIAYVDLPLSVGSLFAPWSYTITNSNPTWGQVSTDVAPAASATELYLNIHAQNGQDFTGPAKLLTPSGYISAQSTLDTDSWIRYSITGAAARTRDRFPMIDHPRRRLSRRRNTSPLQLP